MNLLTLLTTHFGRDVAGIIMSYMPLADISHGLASLENKIDTLGKLSTSYVCDLSDSYYAIDSNGLIWYPSSPIYKNCYFGSFSWRPLFKLFAVLNEIKKY